MATSAGRPPRGRRRAAPRRAGAAPTRNPAPAQRARAESGWDEPLLGPGDGVDDAATAPTPVQAAAPPEADHTEKSPPEAPVVVGTTPGLPARPVGPLVVSPARVNHRSARTKSPRSAAAPPAATAPAAVPPAAVPPAAAAPPNEEGQASATATGDVSGGDDLSGAAQTPSELGRMFSRLLVRMGTVERRLEGLEGRVASDGTIGPERHADDTDEARQAEREYDRQMLDWLADRVEALTAEVDEQRLQAAEQRQQADGRREAVDTAISRADELVAEVARLHARVDEMANAEPTPQEQPACPEHQQLAPTVAAIQEDLAAAVDRATTIEARMAQLESLPSVMEDVAADQFRRLTDELPPAAVDIEAVYKEMDSIAEVVAARDAAVGRALEQVADVETAIAGVRDDMARAVSALTVSSSDDDAGRRLAALERRLEVLESPEHDAERFYSALDRARAAKGALASTPAERPEIPVAGGRSQPEPEPPPTSIPSLLADLDRIRRSLEALAGDGRPSR